MDWSVVLRTGSGLNGDTSCSKTCSKPGEEAGLFSRTRICIQPQCGGAPCEGTVMKLLSVTHMKSHPVLWMVAGENGVNGVSVKIIKPQ